MLVSGRVFVQFFFQICLASEQTESYTPKGCSFDVEYDGLVVKVGFGFED